jgi:hypothetical protein
MESATATGSSNAAGTSGDEASHNRLIASLEEQVASKANFGVTAMEPVPVPDPTWDRVTQASWESFPSSDAPGWR